jgi:hypothetical protein
MENINFEGLWGFPCKTHRNFKKNLKIQMLIKVLKQGSIKLLVYLLEKVNRFFLKKLAVSTADSQLTDNCLPFFRHPECL